MNLRIQAVTLFSRVKSENWFVGTTGSANVVEVTVARLQISLSSAGTVSQSLVGCSGHWSGSASNHWGPFHRQLPVSCDSLSEWHLDVISTTNLWRSLLSSVSSTAQYILKTSAVRATGYNLKCRRTSTKLGCTVGPTRSVSLRDTPVEDFEESKTALIFVVVLVALYTACISR